MIRVRYVLDDLTGLGVRAAVVHTFGEVVWLFDRTALRDDPDATLADASECVEALSNHSFRMRLCAVQDECAS